MTDTHDVTPGHSFPQGEVFLAALDAVVIIDAGGIVRDWNPSAEELFGYTRAEAIGRDVAELIIPPPLRDVHRAALRRHVETGEKRMLDRRLKLPALRRDGSELAIELSVTRLPRAEPLMFAGFIRSLEARQASERASRRLQERMSFLAQAGLVLDRSLEYHDTLRRLADLTVPDLAHMTIIDVLDERARLIELTVAAGREPELAAEVERTRACTRLGVGSHHPVGEVLRTGEPILLRTLTPAYLDEIAQGERHLRLMRDLAYESAIVVPLVARARTLGTLSLLRMTGGPAYTDDDVVLAVELARRAALAVDNARLYESTRALAQTLQASLLPHELPEIPGLRVAGRYRAARRGLEVGGDFYDVFSTGENRWAMTIGDVSGKGAEAAALTALARYTIRAFALRDPGEVLRALNQAVIRDRDVIRGRFLTAVFGLGAVQDGGLALELAVAGHPAPLVLRAGGEVEPVAAAGPLIGLLESARFPIERVRLGGGDMLVLYTDGLTDAQAPRRILSEADLAELVAAGRGRGAAGLAAFLEESVTPAGRPGRDDIAILVVEVAEPGAP